MTIDLDHPRQWIGRGEETGETLAATSPANRRPTAVPPTCGLKIERASWR
ncbi:MAG: hypothetical protein V3V55_03355 [Rhodospirillales bacterium]